VAVANYVGDHQFHFSMLLLMQTAVTLLWRGTLLLFVFYINIVGFLKPQRLKENSNTQRASHYRVAQRDSTCLSFIASSYPARSRRRIFLCTEVAA
jgi:hypothetical protein